MKLSQKIIKLCNNQTNKFKSCRDCIIEKECEKYRQSSIRLYESFSVIFKEMENKVKKYV